MKTRAFFLLFFAMIILPPVSYGQIGVLRRAINRQIDQKIDSAIDKSAQDSRDKKEKEAAAQGQSGKDSVQNKDGSRGSGVLFGGKTDIKYNDEYTFTGRIYMQMETYEKKDVLKTDYYTYYNPNSLDAGIELRPLNPKEGDPSGPTVFLFDNENRCLMMLIDNSGSKTGFISIIPDDSTLAAQSKTKNRATVDEATVTKTGNSRLIAGYTCDEYKVIETGVEGYSNVWMTKDLKLKTDRRNWDKAGIPAAYNYPGFEGAVILAMESFDKSDKLKMKTETIEIDDKFNHSIATGGYLFVKMNFGQARKK